MGIGPSRALRKAKERVPEIERHLRKLTDRHDDPAASHWRHEVRNWIGEVEAMIPHLGRRTGEKWRAQVEVWLRRLGD